MKNQMKQAIKICRISMFLLFITCTFVISLLGQESGSDSVERTKARISLKYINYNNYGPRLKTTVKTKVGRSYIGVADVRVDYYYQELNEDNYIGYGQTDNMGEVIFGIPDTFRKALDTTDHYTFFARVKDNIQVLDAVKDVEATRSKFILTAEEEDSVKTIVLSINGPGEEEHLSPAPDVEIGIFVKRLFGNLPIGDVEYTNEEGELSIIFPDDIPGDSSGNLIIYAQIDDHEDFGTLIGTTQKKWGTLPNNHNDSEARELWSVGSNAPLFLVVIVSLLVTIVWGIIVYLLYEVFRIKKIGLNHNSDMN